MKRLILISSVACLTIFATVFMACSKIQNKENSSSIPIVKKTRASAPRVTYLDGIVVDINSINWDNNLIGFDRGDQAPLYVFTSQNKFTLWVATQPEAIIVLEKNTKLLALRKFVVDNNIEQITENTGIIPESFITYMRANIDPNWKDPRIDPPMLIGNGIGWSLHDKINQGGTMMVGIASNPNYNWFGFNNKASSLGGVFGGIMALCDKTWYTGTFFWIVSGPPFTLATSLVV